jgi:hypothetical protein
MSDTPSIPQKQLSLPQTQPSQAVDKAALQTRQAADQLAAEIAARSTSTPVRVELAAPDDSAQQQIDQRALRSRLPNYPVRLEQIPQEEAQSLIARTIDAMEIEQALLTKVSGSTALPPTAQEAAAPIISETLALPPLPLSESALLELFLTPQNPALQNSVQSGVHPQEEFLQRFLPQSLTLKPGAQQIQILNSPLGGQVQASGSHLQPEALPLKNATLQAVQLSKLSSEDIFQPQLLSSAKAGEVQATFVGKTEKGVPVLRIDHGAAQIKPVSGLPMPAPGEQTQFFLFQASLTDIDIGANLLLSGHAGGESSGAVQTAVTHSALPPMPPEGVPVMPLLAPTMLGTGPWPVMQDIYESLMQAAPQAAQAFSAMTPSVAGGAASTAQMTPAAMFFIAALRGGDMSQWLGQKTADILQNIGKGDLLSRLNGEGRLLGLMADSAPPGEWRALTLPFFGQGEFQRVALHYRHEAPPEDSPEQKGGHVRFLFDLSLDRMGDVQLDGLFNTGGKRLDLIVRTQQPFSQAMMAEMRRIYAGAVEQANVYGELSFQGDPRKWVTIDYKEEAIGVSA